MSILFPFLSIFCCISSAAVHGFVKTENASSKLDFFCKHHNHEDDNKLPNEFELPKIQADHSQEVMLVTGGFRPKKDSLSKYVVSIRTSKATAYFGDNHFCAGAIISERLVLTAAHCVVDRRKIVTRPHRLLVVAGAPNRLKQIYTTVERKVQQVLPHNQFERKGVHDIALLLLKMHLPDDNDNIKVIPLVNEMVIPYSVCQIVGWGQIFFRGPYAANAFHANFTIYPYEYCLKFYPRTFHESMLCGGRDNAWDIDACRGDSGGPLICDGQVAGIISWGLHCGEKGKPTVFTSVYHHREWINFASVGTNLKALHVLLRSFSFLYSQLVCLVLM